MSEENKKRSFHFSGIKKPVVTEKAAISGGLVVKVDRRMTKCEIREAVENAFDVKVSKVRTLNQRGKVKRKMGGVGRRSHTKKAYITLAEGHSVDIIDGV